MCRRGVADAAVDLSNKSASSQMFGSLHATGTSFQVNSAAMAVQVLGGTGTSDTGGTGTRR